MKKDLLQGEEIEQLILRAGNIKKSGKLFSDVIDEEGHQYVDLVQEGGGVLGIGLVGYTYILEQAGIRFYSLAGTSAGAINTLLMASLKKIGEPTSAEILEILSSKNLFDFVDGPTGIKNLVQKLIEGKKGLWLRWLWNIPIIYYQLRFKLGLNPGNNIKVWLSEILSEVGISTYGDLRELRNLLPTLRHRYDPDALITPAKMTVITAEISTHTKVELPAMADLYWKDKNAVCPVEFIRASMSIPVFYYPYRIKNIPNAGETRKCWEEQAGYYGKIPSEVKMVDGGLISNFPINVFHRNAKPTRPTFGVRLSTYRETYSQTDKFFSYCGAIVSTMRQIHDYDFILKNPDYRQLICRINADEKFNWLNFNMEPEKQKQLFLLGAQKGIEFLETFDWEAYKKLREKLVV